MRAVDYILKLQGEPSTNAKQDIIREAYEDGCVEFFKAFQLAYDKRRVFGVKKVETWIDIATMKKNGRPGEATFTWEQFEELVRKLETRELTGYDARDAINLDNLRSDEYEWNHLYRPILMKDMRCGTSDTLVNKVLNKLLKEEEQRIWDGKVLDNFTMLEIRKLLVPVWKVQLAQDSKKHLKKLKGLKAIDPKLDGMRLTAILDKELGTARLFSRSGKENTNFNEIITDLETIIDKLPWSMVLDGEVVSANFQTLMTQANRKSEVDTSDSHFALFDMLSLKEFQKGICKDTLYARDFKLQAMAENIQSKSGSDRVYAIPKRWINLDDHAGMAEMKRFYGEMLEAGYEGIMVKDRDAPYECKRTTTWLKWKPVNSVDLRIVAAIEGEAGKRREGKLGAFTCEGTEDGKHIVVNVGSGYNDAQLDEFWQDQASLIGEIAEIEYDSITKSSDGAYWSLRFPRFKCFRSIDQGEKM